MSIPFYYVAERIVYDVIEITDEDKVYLMDSFESESEAEIYKNECTKKAKKEKGKWVE